MLSVRYRFHGHGSLRYLFKNGQAVRSRYLTVKYIHNPRRNRCRVSVIVSKKVHKSAVGRNRIRRRLYEIIRHRMDDIHTPHDIAVIVTSAEVLSLDHQSLKQQVEEVFTQAGLYKNAIKWYSSNDTTTE